MPFPVDINGFAFAQTFISRRFARMADSLLSGLGAERIAWLIQNDASLLDLIPEAERGKFQAQARDYRVFAEALDPEKAYSLLPLQTRQLIDAYEDGHDWALRQLAEIKTFIQTS